MVRISEIEEAYAVPRKGEVAGGKDQGVRKGEKHSAEHEAGQEPWLEVKHVWAEQRLPAWIREVEVEVVVVGGVQKMLNGSVGGCWEVGRRGKQKRFVCGGT
eukprot:1502347-Rhodomonas_salina.1